MSPVFWATYGLLWTILAALAVLVILLYRQFGVMIMPGPQRINSGGLNVGSRAPAVLVSINGDHELAFDWSSLSPGKLPVGTFALFALPTCPICSRLAEDSQTMADVAARHETLQFIWIQQSQAPGHEIHLPQNWTNALSHNAAAHDAMEIPGSPFAYLISARGKILAKGLINSVQDIDSMIATAPTPAEPSKVLRLTS
jgi:hypothetical protein